MATEPGFTRVSMPRKQNLILRIEQTLPESDTVLHADGVLEIADEGYGSLSTQDFNYLNGPDDIYVSPSPIKRFDLRTEDSVLGQVQRPNQWEQ